LRAVAARRVDALRLPFGADRVRQCARDPDLFGPGAPDARGELAYLRDDRGGAWHYLSRAAAHDGDPVATDLHPGADRDQRRSADAATHGGRSRTAAVIASQPRAAAR